MTDITYTPARSETGGIGVLVGGIAIVMFALLFVFYGLPALRGETLTSTPEALVQKAPIAESGDGVSIEIVDEVDASVKQPQE